MCAYPDSEPCEPEDWNDERDAAATGCGYATPSPVLDSERPASELIERLTEMVRLIDWRGSEARLRNLLTEAVIALEAADAHRCPTPEPEFYGRLVCASCGQVPSAHIGPVGNYCPGPLPTPERDDLAELRAARRRTRETTDRLAYTDLYNAVDRLLASHPGGDQ